MPLIQTGIQGSSYIIFDTIGTTTAGWGSVRTKVARFTNLTTVGTDLTGAQSSTNGDSISCNVAGLYLLEGNIVSNSSSRSTIIITKNAADYTTDPIGSQITGTLIRGEQATASDTTGNAIPISRLCVLAVNDILRLHGRGVDQAFHAEAYFQMTRIK